MILKIRMDYVTNSSSTSFCVASIGVILTSLSSVLGLSMAYANSQAGHELAGNEILNRGEFDPSSVVNSDLSYEEKLDLLDKEKLQYKNEWESIKDSISAEDYENTKRGYDDYIKYIDDMKAEAEYLEYEKEVEKIKAEAALEYKNQWIDNTKSSLRNTRDEIGYLQATIRGYGEAGFDTSEMERQLNSYMEYEKDIVKSLSREDIKYDYKIQDRGSIGPSKDMIEYVIRQELEKQAEMNAEKKAKKIKILRRMNEAYKEESAAYQEFANTADNYTKGGEIVQLGADMAIDGLEKVTGPVGKKIKIVYVGAKGIAGGVGEAVAEGKNYGSHITKGLVKGGADVIKELTGDKKAMEALGGKKFGKYIKYTKEAVTVSSESLMGGIDAAKDGKSVLKGMTKGAFKGTIDVGGDMLADKYIPPSDVELDNLGSTSVKNYVKAIVKKNPTIANNTKEAIKSSVRSAVVGQTKNLAKGDSVVFDKNKYEWF